MQFFTRLACVAALAAAAAAGKTLVVVTAHADDFSIFAGGTIAKLTDAGYTAYVIRVTEDEKDGVTSAPENSARNGREIRDAARILGIKDIFQLNQKNDELETVSPTELMGKLILLIRRLRPDVVMTFDPWAAYEENPDHVKTGRITVQACWMAQIDRFYPEQIRAGLRPFYVNELYLWSRGPHTVNKVVDISSTIDRKIKAVEAHRGMIRDPQILIDLRQANRKLGELNHMQYAELFHYTNSIGTGSGDNYKALEIVPMEKPQ
jgi:LmbE family N-acetylglucosaminyl deacetylase